MSDNTPAPDLNTSGAQMKFVVLSFVTACLLILSAAYGIDSPSSSVTRTILIVCLIPAIVAAFLSGMEIFKYLAQLSQKRQ